MISSPNDVLTAFPVRKSKRQKAAFREAVQEYAQTLGYSCKEETGSFGARNLVLGDPEQADYLITAHYDTCARLPFPNFITPCNLWMFIGFQMLLIVPFVLMGFFMGLASALIFDSPAAAFWAAEIAVFGCIYLMLFGPANPSNANDNTSGVITLLEIARTLPENQRHKVCFVLFDLEEAGLIGSASYRKAHKQATDRQLVLNLDCVGDGDYIRLFPGKKVRKDKRMFQSLYRACGYFGSKEIVLHEKGFSVYPSDQANFPYGVGICALRKKWFGLYMGWIHTPKDTILEERNVQLLRAALTSFVCCDKEQAYKNQQETDVPEGSK